MRILLFTGKGGVGKTTTAAATAVRCADVGQRTIVLSTDPAHSLADAFDVDLGDGASPVTDGLWAQQLDAQERMEDAWVDIQRYLEEVFRWGGVDEIEAEELAVVPGLDEVFALTDIKRCASSGEWDTIVVDCAPTAETIRLLSLPGVLAWWMERLFPMGRRVNKVVSPLLGSVTKLPVPGDDVFAGIERFSGSSRLATTASTTPCLIRGSRTGSSGTSTTWPPSRRASPPCRCCPPSWPRTSWSVSSACASSAPLCDGTLRVTFVPSSG